MCVCVCVLFLSHSSSRTLTLHKLGAEQKRPAPKHRVAMCYVSMLTGSSRRPTLTESCSVRLRDSTSNFL